VRYLTTQQPTTEPITLADARAHCRVDDTDEDAIIVGLIAAARRHCEQVLAEALIDQQITVAWSTDDYIPRSPKTGDRIYYLPIRYATAITAVTDQDGETVPADDFVFSAVLNTIRTGRDLAQVVYRAGASDPADVAPTTRQAMLMLVAHWYEHRASVTTDATPYEVQMAAAALLQPGRSLGL
jgi:uncharacterized phiE125 gp8 family phage protein